MTTDPDKMNYYGKDDFTSRRAPRRSSADPLSTADQTFFFWDLETTGLDPREDRIMQFAGIRTDLDFNQIGEPVDLLVKLANDTLPSPSALIVTKISPLSTQLDGLTEAEFCKYVSEEIFTPGTIAVGYNSVRFDDEFMRNTLWRNFYDPYEREWKDMRSRWDILDLVRMTRALRPEGISWPVVRAEKTEKADNGAGKMVNVKRIELKPANRLELLTKANGLPHEHAHDALSDVEATVSVARMISERQPDLFGWLLKARDKAVVRQIANIDSARPFVYSTGRYPWQHEYTSVAVPIANIGSSSRPRGVLVYDLRYNLDELLEQEKNFVSEKKTDRSGRIYDTKFSWHPIVKQLLYNKCPAVAPLGVLESASLEPSTDETNPQPQGSTGWQKLDLTMDQIKQNLLALKNHPEFIARMKKEEEERPEFPAAVDDESALYDGFLGDADRAACVKVHNAKFADLKKLHPEFDDKRLASLFIHYKAKNFPGTLTDDEKREWERYRKARLTRQEKKFVGELWKYQKLADEGKPTPDGRTIDPSVLQDLKDWYQSLSESSYEENSEEEPIE